jgi:uncharacterized RDD family membrane protein YckC
MTPENISVARDSAPLWRRFAALGYDLLIIAALSMAYAALAIAIYVNMTGEKGEAYTPMFEGPLFQLGWLALILGFYLFFWSRGGQTLGMRAWRLRLTDRHGQSPSLKQCALRCLVGPLALGLAAFGYWWAWFDRDGYCWHDRISGTRVVVLKKPQATSRKL